MGKLQKLQCESCGGHIDGCTLRCQMCGMQYRIDDDFTLTNVEVYNGKFLTIEGKVTVPAYTLYEFGEDGPVKACEMTIKKLASTMSEHIIPFMDFKQYYDPRKMQLETFAEVRVAEPRQSQIIRERNGVPSFLYNGFAEHRIGG